MTSQALTLRPYQETAITDLRRAYRWGRKAPLLVAPTGMGKTIILAAIVRGVSDYGRRALILVHRRELIHQTSAKLNLAGVEHGIIAAGVEPSPVPVQVASVQTLVRRLDQLDFTPDLIIIDEAHHACSESWRKILNHWPDTPRLGVTATPVRLDGRGLGNVFDDLILGPSVANLISLGFLTPSRIYAPPPVADLSKLRTRAGDFTPEQAAEQLDRPTVTGDAIDHYQRLAPGQPAIAFCCTTQHAEHVAQQFRAAGIRAETLLGSTPLERREQLVAQLRDGSLQVMVTVDVVSEGFDCPGAVVAILLRPTQSEGLYLQQVGRVLRPACDKTCALVLDHVGNVHRHGFPDDLRRWTLDDSRKRSRGNGPAAPSVRTCQHCFAAFRPQPTCPVCGHNCAPQNPRQIKQVSGELKELKREEVKQRVAERKAARTLQQLLALAKERGYSPGWAHKIHNARQIKSGTQ